MVQKVSEWLKGQGIGTSAIYHSKNIEPTRTAYGLAGEFPHVKLLELELLEGEYELGDGVELDALLETEDGFDGFDTIVLITHEPVVRVIAKRRGVSADPIGYATTIIFFPNGGWEKFSPGWCGW
jgi:phosphohistidine phosphatase SixA